RRSFGGAAQRLRGDARRERDRRDGAGGAPSPRRPHLRRRGGGAAAPDGAERGADGGAAAPVHPLARLGESLEGGRRGARVRLLVLALAHDAADSRGRGLQALVADVAAAFLATA